MMRGGPAVLPSHRRQIPCPPAINRARRVHFLLPRSPTKTLDQTPEIGSRRGRVPGAVAIFSRAVVVALKPLFSVRRYLDARLRRHKGLRGLSESLRPSPRTSRGRGRRSATVFGFSLPLHAR